jgi:ABC-type branched-subunit amino acid transport system ATPase component
MDKLTSLSLSEFSKFTTDLKTGIVSVPNEYELYKKLTIENQIKIWQAEIAQYEAEKEPTTEELIELGKSMHPYYMNQERKQELIERIKSYTIKVVEPVILK